MPYLINDGDDFDPNDGGPCARLIAFVGGSLDGARLPFQPDLEPKAFIKPEGAQEEYRFDPDSREYHRIR
jgi:hypothetical protein